LKRILFIFTVLIVFCTGCFGQNNVIQEINRKVDRSEYVNFISLIDLEAVLLYGKSMISGIVVLKSDDRLESNIGLYPKSKFPLVTSYSWISLDSDLYDYKNCLAKTIRFKNNGTSKIKNRDFTNIKPRQLYNTCAWENTPRGVAISPKYVDLSTEKEVVINNQKWQLYVGKYDLSNTNNRMPGSLQGYLYLWYAVDKQAVVELYTDTTKKPLVIRKLYLDNKEIFKDEPRDNPENLVKMFMTLYEEAGFSEFMATLK
jgi:hypothetical protein